MRQNQGTWHVTYTPIVTETRYDVNLVLRLEHYSFPLFDSIIYAVSHHHTSNRTADALRPN